MNLHIEIVEQCQRKPLVFFHGWGFDHQIFLSLADRLKDNYSFFLVDLPGFGRTSIMPWNIFKQNLLERLPKQFALLGWSLGGLYAIRLAIEAKERVTELISIASSPKFMKDEDWPGIQPSALDSFFLNLKSNPEKTRKEFMALQLLDQIQQTLAFKASEAGLQAGLEVLAKWDMREKLGGFNKPALFIFGRLDSIVPKATLNAMQKIYLNFNYQLLKKSAHMPFLSHQDEFLKILNDFFYKNQ
jgi:pimeloyl-[acyl-carrier protein] methyl ester esterase